MGSRTAQFLLMVCVMLGVNGCQAKNDAMLPVRILPGPSGPFEYDDVEWLDHGLVVEYLPQDRSKRYLLSAKLGRVDVQSGKLEMLRLPDYPGCEHNGFEAPVRMPDGRLAYIVRCLPPGVYVWQLYMMAFDPQTEHVTPLLSYTLPSRQVGSGGYSWNPDMSRGITSDGNGAGLSEQLYWITPDHWEPLDVGLPQALGSDWSPDGTKIAFVGAPEQGLEGVGRADAVFNLYLMKPDGSDRHSLLTGFRYPSPVSWSRDSHWIVFNATFGRLLTQTGLWLVDVDTGKRFLIAPGYFSTPAWSPDGSQLVSLQTTGSYPNDHTKLVILDIGKLLERLRNKAKIVR